MFLSERDRYLTMGDAELAACCRCDCYCGSGPGGQHRNRNYTGIRMVFQPLPELAAEDETERSQLANRRKALGKLRLLIARRCRLEVAENPRYVHVNTENQNYALELAHLLDVVELFGFDHRKAAARLSLSPSRLLKELGRDHESWREFQERRAELNMPELKLPR